MTEQSPQITQLSSVVTTGAATANAAIPNAASGLPARVVRVVVDTGSCFVNFGPTGVTAAAATGILITTIPSLFNVEFADHFAYIQNGSASKLCISPTERYR